MKTFLVEFYDRRAEVQQYLAVLRFAEKRLSGDIKTRKESEARIFRAAALLVIYNAIEASARSAIQAIYDEIEQSATPFSLLRQSIRRRVIRDFKVNAGEDAHHAMQNVAIEMIVASFNPQRVFSGNVDAREIRAQSKDYGFDTTTDYVTSQHGKHLVTVKNKRNDLAHGIASFSTVGKDYTLRELQQISRFSLAYMEGILKNIDKYLDERHYLEESA
jgi:hypothetical protein